jgi:uncharacterized protein with HEPN domain
MMDEKVYLTYVLDSIAGIQELAAAGRNALMGARHDKAAVLYYLHTMAEATQRLTDATRSAYPDIPWTAISSFRNRLIHGYLDLNWTIVWEIIEKDLPPLKAAVATMLAEANRGSDVTEG